MIMQMKQNFTDINQFFKKTYITKIHVLKIYFYTSNAYQIYVNDIFTC